MQPQAPSMFTGARNHDAVGVSNVGPSHHHTGNSGHSASRTAYHRPTASTSSSPSWFSSRPSHSSASAPHCHNYNRNHSWINPFSWEPTSWFSSPSVVHVSTPRRYVFIPSPEARLASAIAGVFLGIALMALAIEPIVFILGASLTAISFLGVADSSRRLRTH